MGESNIQFKGMEAALEAFEMKNVDTWALYQGRNLFHKGSGAAELETWLKLLKENTRGRYQLCVYEGKEPDQVNSKTAHDGSFSFTLHEDAEVYGSNDVATRMMEMDRRLKEIEEGKDLEEEPTGIIGQILNHPALETVLPMVVPRIMDLIFGKSNVEPVAAHATMAGVEDDEQKLAEALRILRQADPGLPDHLTKLAKIAQEKPDQFKMLLSMLGAQ